MGSLSAWTVGLVAVLGLGSALNCGQVHGREEMGLNVSAVILPRTACRIAWDGDGRLAAVSASRMPRCDGSTATYRNVAASVAARRAGISKDAVLLNIEF